MKSLAPVILIAALVGGAVAIAKATNSMASKPGEKFFMSGMLSWPPGEKPALSEMFSRANGYSGLNVYTDSNTPANSAKVSVVFEPAVIGASMGDVSTLPGETIEVMGFRWAIKEAYKV